MENETIETTKLSPKAKAAMLIRMFTTETAQKVIQYLSKEEQEMLAQEITKNTVYTKDELNEVMSEYIFYFGSRNIGTMGSGIEYLRSLFKHMAEKDFQKMLGRVYYDMDNPFEFLNQIKDVESLITTIGKEDSQTIALVCNYLDSKMAGDLLQALPEEKMIDTVVALAKLDQVDGELMAKIGKAIETQINKMSIGDSNQQDGIKSVVGILNNVPRGIEKVVLERLDAIDKPLSETIKENLFTFDDLIVLDNLTLQKVLNEVQDVGSLAKAMKIAKEELKEKLFQNMSEGRRDMVNQELDGMGPIKMKDAEKAQQDIANLVKKLEKDGKIQIARGDEDVIL